MNDDVLKLKNQLCFPLYACSREVIKSYKPYLDPLNLTYTQYLVMLVLWEEDNISVKYLGDKLFLDSGTLTPLLKKMEAQKLITRQRSADDERSVVINLTKEGKDLKQKAVEIPHKMLSCIELPFEELKGTYDALYKLLGILTKENNQ